MAEYIYSVWFTHSAADPEDQDREWVACVSIDAPRAEEAQAWGDALAHDRAARLPDDQFTRSSVELRQNVRDVADWSSVPRIRSGQFASDAEIGW